MLRSMDSLTLRSFLALKVPLVFIHRFVGYLEQTTSGNSNSQGLGHLDLCFPCVINPGMALHVSLSSVGLSFLTCHIEVWNDAITY